MDKNIFYNYNLLNKNKLRENWVKKHNGEYDLLKSFQMENNLSGVKFSQVIYNYIDNITEIPLCKYCSINNRRFIGFTDGYNDFCSKKCAYKFSLPNAIKNRKQNTIDKHGVDHTSKLLSVKEKQKNTNISRYGCKSPTLNNEIREKQKDTMIKKYGVEYTGNSKKLMDKVFNTRFEKYQKLIFSNYKDLKIINIIKEGELEIQCGLCNSNYTIKTELLRLRVMRYNVNPCLICNPLNKYKDTKENEIVDYILSKGIEVIKNDRKILNGKEIDIYIPYLKLGIEFNGLYWHSDIYKDKKYHLNKKKECFNKDVNLIHIWEDNWIYNPDIVKSRINNLLNINMERIMARKCSIKNVSSSESKLFLDKNHLQGNIYSSYNIGLYSDSELVSIMTFGKLRRGLGYIKSDGWELYRFCSKLDINVIGGFNKLLKHFENEKCPKSLLTYANRDWSTGDNIYINNGFVFKGETEVNYWYFGDEIKRKHRFQFRKDKLVKEGFDPNKTEYEIMSERGYYRIFDCGNLKYIKEY